MSKRLTTEEFIIRAKNIHGDKYDYSEVIYINNKTKVKIKCKLHGIFEQLPSNHIYQSRGCILCHLDSRRLSVNAFINKANIIHNNIYDYSNVVYVNNSTKVSIRCPKHGKFKMRPNNHLDSKQGCPKCAGYVKLTNATFILKANSVHNYKYDYTKVNYILSQIKVIIVCTQHGEFEMRPNDHLSGHGCSICKSSKGETFINTILHSQNITHKHQYSFDNCIHKGKLNFDFYLPNINCCIEYDGKQHFEPITFFGGKLSFNELKIRDAIKTKFCKDNGIYLIRIPYTEFNNIGVILESKLNNI